MAFSSTSTPSDDSDLVSDGTSAVPAEIRLRTMPAAHCAALAGALAAARPADLDAREARLLAIVMSTADDVQAARTSAEGRGTPRVRVAALAFGNAWAAIGEVLAGLGRLPTQSGRDALGLSAVLFADGARFVKLDATAAWSEGRRRLDRLASDAPAGALAALVGQEAAAHLPSVTAALGEAVHGKALARGTTPRASVRTAVDRFARAVAAYVRALAGQLDDESAAAAERFARATAPLAEYRRARRKKIREPRNAFGAGRISQTKAKETGPEAP